MAQPFGRLAANPAILALFSSGIYKKNAPMAREAALSTPKKGPISGVPFGRPKANPLVNLKSKISLDFRFFLCQDTFVKSMFWFFF
jgi:hypothetical protein